MSKPEEKIILDLCGGTGSWSRPWQLNGIELLFYQKCILAMMCEADNILPNKRKFLF